jgi:glutathione S-transferase
MMRLYRFRYSPYARKVQALLEVAGIAHEVIEVRYGEREELARLTGGYIHVPVLVDDDGTVVVESRAICERLVARPAARALVPAALDAAIWAFCDHVDGAVEDVLFRIGSPGVRAQWPTAWERALYTLIKERKYGAGCVDRWAAEQAALIERAQAVLEPVRRTLAHQPYVFGGELTLADLALYGQWAMLDEADAGLVDRVSPVFAAHARRVEAAGRVARR